MFSVVIAGIILKGYCWYVSAIKEVLSKNWTEPIQCFSREPPYWLVIYKKTGNMPLSFVR